MEYILPEQLTQLLLIASALSVFVMAALQRFKQLPWIANDYQIWLLNLALSFGIGIPFYLSFYVEFEALDALSFTVFAPALWVSFLAFLGAPALFSALKNYTPKTLKQIHEDDPNGEDTFILGDEQ